MKQHYGVLLLLAAATGQPACEPLAGNRSGDGGISDARAGDGSAGPDASPNATTPIEAGPVDAGASGPDAAPDSSASPDGDAGDADSPDGAPAIVTGPAYANWPMPNPPSSGYPNAASYDTSRQGIVVDNVTGLMWERQELAGYDTQQAAAAHCTGLRLGAFADWRLPSRVEIVSIDDFTRYSPALDPVFGTVLSDPSDPDSQDQGGTPWTTTLTRAQYVDDSLFTTLDELSGQITAARDTVRCVRGSTAQPDPRYTIQNGTVYDRGTKLTWQQGYDPQPSLPNGVANYCGGLALGGGGWRAPSVKELETIVDEQATFPALDTGIFSTPTDSQGLSYWSTSIWAAPAASPAEALYVDFHDWTMGVGDSTIALPGQNGANNLRTVRCVR